jgi:hypothetical protein
MPRPKKHETARRVQIRLSDYHAEIFDSYSVDQINQLVAKALDTITPDYDPGIVAPSVFKPKNILTITIARVSVENLKIRVLFPEKIEQFRLLARELKYFWESPYWVRQFKEEALICDRAAELCCRTLELGIPIQINYTGVRDKIVSGKFQLEPVRQIKVIVSGAYQGWFCFSWPRGEDWYSKAMSLTAAKYIDGRVSVPPEHFSEIEDFAETEEFELSEAARAALSDAKKLSEIELLIDVRPISKRRQAKTRSATAAVPDHLKDDTIESPISSD